MATSRDIPDGVQLTPFDDDFYADPYPVYRRLRTLEPVHRDEVSFYPRSWTISDYNTVSRLLKDPRLSVDPRRIGLRRDPRADNPVTLRKPDMMNLDGAEHQRLRSLVHKAFTPSSVDQFAPVISSIAQTCISALQVPEFDVVSGYSKPLPTMVIASYIGVDPADHAQFKHWTDELLMQGYPAPTGDQWDRIVAADAALRTYVADVIRQRKATPQNDLVTRLTRAHTEVGRLTDDEVIDMCFLLIGAGNFTTTDLISNCIHLGIREGVGADRAEELVEECLRLDPPVLAVRRFVTEDLEVNGRTITRGSAVNLLVASANHDAAEFNNADNFEPARGGSRHLSFGRGIHHCLGAPLARLESVIAVRAFFSRFPEARVLSARRNKRMDFRGFSELLVAV